MENKKTTEIFEKAPVSKAVFQNALPVMAAMLMVLIYNLADTFLSARPTMLCWWPLFPWRRRYF